MSDNNEDRDTFIFYRSFKESMTDLSDTDKLIMYEAISDYSLDLKEPELTGFPKALFCIIKPLLDANIQRWRNGKNGGAPKGSRNNPNGRGANKTNQELTENKPETNREQTKNKANKDKDKDKDKNKDNNESTNVDNKYPYQDIVNAWNSICISLPKVVKLTETRKNKIKARLKEFDPSLDRIMFIQSLFESVEASSFLRGESSNWQASFDWMFENGSNWVKVSEGNYKNKDVQKVPSANGVSLGVGERIENGRRTYGSGAASVLMDAPARPSEQYIWDAGSLNWIIL